MIFYMYFLSNFEFLKCFREESLLIMKKKRIKNFQNFPPFAFFYNLWQDQYYLILVA